MKYACLIYLDEEKLDGLSDADWKSLGDRTRDFEDGLRRDGYLVASETLSSVRTATTLRVRSGRLSTADGPVAGSGEQLGGFLVIEARDLNEALRLAAKIPAGRLGGIEVRPVRDLHGGGNREDLQMRTGST